MTVFFGSDNLIEIATTCIAEKRRVQAGMDKRALKDITFKTYKNMKRFRTWVFLLSLPLLLATGCSQGLLSERDEKPQTTEVSFNIGISTRNDAAGASDDIRPELHQHVEHVSLYLFKGEAFMAAESVDWQQETGKTVEQNYTLQNKLEIGETYTLFAVGMNEKDIYQISTDESLTPSTIYAKLVDGKTAEERRKAEIFAGSIEYTPTESHETMSINLYRRMAGIEATFTSIPENATIQVVAHQKQNSAIALQKKETDDYGTDPFEEEGASVLLTITPDTDGKGEAYGYVLPICPPKSGSTLSVVLLGQNGSEEGKFPVVLCDPADGMDSKRFPLNANRLYRLKGDLAPGFRFYVTIEDLEEGGDYYYEYD